MESFGALVSATVFCLFIVRFQVCQAAQTWSYLGSADGVDKWAQNYPGQCDGQRQSPVDLNSDKVHYDKDLEAFQFQGFQDTNGVTWEMNNNGHTVTVTYTSGDLTVSGGSLITPYKVAQFHFHWGQDSTKGSEHLVDGHAYPMEVHIVCYNSIYADLGAAVTQSDGLAVLGFFFEISPNTNPTMQNLIDHFTQVKYATNSTTVTPFPLTNLMAGVTDYYRYLGGLTTPTCNEVVTWTVFRDTIKISEAQMGSFRSLMDAHNHNLVDNYRPPQLLYSRSILASWDDPRFSRAAGGLALSSLALLASLLVSLGFRL